MLVIESVAGALPFAGTEIGDGEAVQVAPVGQPLLTERETLPASPFTEVTVTV